MRNVSFMRPAHSAAIARIAANATSRETGSVDCGGPRRAVTRTAPDESVRSGTPPLSAGRQSADDRPSPSDAAKPGASTGKDRDE